MTAAPTRADRSSTWAADRAFAIETARRAGVVLLDRYERLERVHRKSAKDVVTEADHLSEELIISSIRTHAPGDGILAEESGSHSAAGGVAATAGTGRVWIVDPLDGTVNYANGIPFFCVSIALVVDGQPVVGVVRDPARDETFATAVDGPAALVDRESPGGRPIVASEKGAMSDFVVALSVSGRAAATRVLRIRKAVRVGRNMGAAALELAYIANGRFDALVQTAGLSAWDIAAAGLIAERAGATVTDANGGPWFDLSRKGNVNGIVAAPARFHAEILALSR